MKVFLDEFFFAIWMKVYLTATYNTERAKLWDIQDQKIEARSKKIVDVKFHGQTNETPVPASRWMCPISRETLLPWADC